MKPWSKGKEPEPLEVFAKEKIFCIVVEVKTEKDPSGARIVERDY